MEVTCDGATARTNLAVFSHIRRSSFQLVNWGRAKGPEQLPLGEENLGFNLFYGQGAHDEEAHLIRAGVDFMGCCVTSGGHQMDLRAECDWSDPWVIRGGTRRATQRAFVDRTRPNVWGVHFYDEPGLTWAKDPETGQSTPHVVPWQLRQYEAAFGQSMLDWKRVDPKRCQAVQGIVESNQLAARLGPIFNTMPVSRPPVAILFSLSQFLHAQTENREVNYAHDTAHGRNVMFTYLAGKLLQHQFMPLLDEEVLDGTLLAHHQAIILTSLD